MTWMMLVLERSRIWITFFEHSFLATILKPVFYLVLGALSNLPVRWRSNGSCVKAAGRRGYLTGKRLEPEALVIERYRFTCS